MSDTAFTNVGCEVEVEGNWQDVGARIVVTTPVGVLVAGVVFAIEDGDNAPVIVDIGDGDLLRLYKSREDCPDASWL